MSIIIPPRQEPTEPTEPQYPLIGYNPAHGGCTFPKCRTQDTLTLCGRYGRRCRAHAPWVTLADEGKDGLAYWSLRAFTSGRAA